MHSFDKEDLDRRNVFPLILHITGGMYVIIQRSRIELLNKLMYGVRSCEGIISLCVVLVVSSGAIFWLIERFNHPTMNTKEFAQSLINSLWWSIITMTTVGYGDVYPTTRFGRVWAVCWMYIALLSTSIITATVSSIVFGIDDYAISGKTVAVLRDSPEHYAAVETYQSHAIPKKSYDDVYDAVRRGEAFAGLVSHDVASWNQEKIRGSGVNTPLAIINKLPVEGAIRYFFGKTSRKDFIEINACLYRYMDASYSVFRHYERQLQLETIHFVSLEEQFGTISFQAILSITVGLFLLGVAYDFSKGTLFLCLRHKKVPSDRDGRERQHLNEFIKKEFENLKIELAFDQDADARL